MPILTMMRRNYVIPFVITATLAIYFILPGRMVHSPSSAFFIAALSSIPLVVLDKFLERRADRKRALRAANDRLQDARHPSTTD